MFKFDMSLSQNFAIFYDGDDVVLVDSFDNNHFDVRMGTMTNSEMIGSITASSDYSFRMQRATCCTNDSTSVSDSRFPRSVHLDARKI